jgi:hypothetical protein
VEEEKGREGRRQTSTRPIARVRWQIAERGCSDGDEEEEEEEQRRHQQQQSTDRRQNSETGGCSEKGKDGGVARLGRASASGALHLMSDGIGQAGQSSASWHSARQAGDERR